MSRDRILLGWALATLALGGGLRLWPGSAIADPVALSGWIWMLGVAPVLAALLAEIWHGLRRGEAGLDIVAALSMSAALLVGETLAAAVVAVMYAGGTFLERLAEGRARSEMQALLARAPRSATLHTPEGLRSVPIEALSPGDRVLVRRGETVPADGILASVRAVLDASALTGEALPQRLRAGDEALSGAVNVGDAFDLTLRRGASESTYAGILRLVAAAQAERAPLARLADRWSLWFLALTVVLALAAWAISGDPVRAVAVLVVATPCPLILAVPVALVAGLSRAAQAGVLVKGAGVLEAMARTRVMIFDKTGTLTDGRPQLTAILPVGPSGNAETAQTRLLRLTAALEQASQHPVASAIVAAAQARGLTLEAPADVVETPGEGLVGRAEGLRLAVGGVDFVAAHLRAAGKAAQPADVPPIPPAPPGTLVVAVAIDDAFAGHLLMSDPLRGDAAALIADLRAEGVARLVLATGDRAEIAAHVTRGLGLDRVAAGLDPAAKVALVRAEAAAAAQAGQGAVMMVGDGVNDAPALAAAQVGVAMGARGAAASAEAAGVVLLVDRLAPLRAGIAIARGARTIALQSVAVGIGLSVLGMLAAAAGYLAPVQGALLQEAIDVAVILNALRALRLHPATHRPNTQV